MKKNINKTISIVLATILFGAIFSHAEVITRSKITGIANTDKTNELLSNAISTKNSTMSNLTGNETFIGEWEDISQYSAMAFASKSDQASATNGIHFHWSVDGSTIIQDEHAAALADTNVFRQLMMEAQYFRIEYHNGAIDQTSFELQLILMKTPSLGEVQQLSEMLDDTGDAQLVRAVLAAKKPDDSYANIQATAGGNLKISLEEFESAAFNNNPLPVMERSRTAFGEVLVGQLSPQFQGSFEYTVSNTDLNTNTVVNGGTVTQASGMAVVGSSTTTSSTALFQSKQHGKYRAGIGGNDRFTVLLPSFVAATEQYIGLADEIGSSAAFKNGYVIGYDGTVFGFHRFQNDSKITIAQADWDDPLLDGTGTSGMTLDHTKLNVWQIKYQYLGAGKIELSVEDDSTGDFVVAHTVLYANNFTEPSVHNPNFHHTMWVNNGATTSDIVLKSASYGYFVEGKTSFVELHQPENSSGTKEKTGVTAEVAIFTIRNKSTYASKTNFIDIILLSASASIEASSANNLGTVRLVKNATLGGTPSWSDINTSNSVMEIDTSGTTVTGGKELDSIELAGKNDRDRIPLIDYKIILNPGESITMAGSSANSATIRSHVAGRELF